MLGLRGCCLRAKVGGRASTLRFLSQDAHCAPYPKRTHNCGTLSAADVGKKVVLAGWLLPERKAGKHVSFFPLKDSSGATQLVVKRDGSAAGLSDVTVESVVLVEGEVSLRPENQRRGGTADIDIVVSDFKVLNPAQEDLPFVPSDATNIVTLSENIQKRSKVAHTARTVLEQEGTFSTPLSAYDRSQHIPLGFTEVETPVLLRSSPEGAREYLVPSRIARAEDERPVFYALQQSPQQPKQLLICSGAVDRYFQLAKCFRDEGGRKDRQPEFTQIDMEMAFVSWGPDDASLARGWRIGGAEVRDTIERLVPAMWATAEGTELPSAFPVMTYQEAMNRFGSDKPDTRFGLEISDITPYLPSAQREALERGGDILQALIVRGGDFTAASQAAQSGDITERILIDEGNRTSWHRTSSILAELPSPSDSACEIPSLQPGDHLWLARRTKLAQGGSTPLGKLRLQLSELAQQRGDLTLPAHARNFLWITEFPLFTHADEDKEFLAHGRWSSSHHPFTAPMWEDVPKMYDGRINEVRGQHYDLVLNGVEIGGGSVRVHDAAMQDHIFTNILQLSPSEKAPFEHLLHALRCGAPPHGGIALGFDRIMSILCNTPSIRDVIAFPKTSGGTDLLFRSPAPVGEDVLREYRLEYLKKPATST
ncbi:tRNA synthetases class II-domain-containing protein [Schizophyllum commune]